MTLIGRSSAATSPEVRFRDLFATHYPDIYGYAARRVGRDDAADVAADVFTVAWRSLNRVPDPPDTRPWLFGVARNVVSNHLRSARRRDRLAIRAAAAEQAPVVPAHEGNDDVIDALRSLGDDDQEILRLAAWEALQPREIAQVLGCSSNAAAVRLHRARARLADAYRSRGGRS
jgi:RNA polymerase sigma-70 factor (ECF subfamily)